MHINDLTQNPAPKKIRLCTHKPRGATAAWHSSARPAYTLIELLLVLAIIIMAAAAVAPSMRNFAKNSALKSAASEIRAELTRAHVQAMRTSRTQVFQYELGGRKYKIEPWIGDDDTLEGAGAPEPAITAAPQQPSPTGLNPGERQLPENIRFALGDAAIESRSERIEEQLATSSGQVTWSRPILFFRDGASVNAFVVIASDRDAAIRLDLRGLTATVKISGLKSLQEFESTPPTQ